MPEDADAAISLRLRLAAVTPHAAAEDTDVFTADVTLLPSPSCFAARLRDIVTGVAAGTTYGGRREKVVAHYASRLRPPLRCRSSPSI